jgi:hypothetical protein
MTQDGGEDKDRVRVWTDLVEVLVIEGLRCTARTFFSFARVKVARTRITEVIGV